VFGVLSGMNDGLALPAVLAFTAALVGAGPEGEEFVWWEFVGPARGGAGYA
jgi:hypothetical protein